MFSLSGNFPERIAFSKEPANSVALRQSSTEPWTISPVKTSKPSGAEYLKSGYEYPRGGETRFDFGHRVSFCADLISQRPEGSYHDSNTRLGTFGAIPASVSWLSQSKI